MTLGDMRNIQVSDQTIKMCDLIFYIRLINVLSHARTRTDFCDKQASSRKPHRHLLWVRDLLLICRMDILMTLELPRAAAGPCSCLGRVSF